MKNKSIQRVFTLILMIVMVLSFSSIVMANPYFAEVKTKGVFDFDECMKLVELVNKEREKNGLNPLKYDFAFQDYAIQRAAEQVFWLGHDRPNGYHFYNADDGSRIPLIMGENAAVNESYYEEGESADFVFKRWMDSDGHRANILDPAFKSITVANWVDVASQKDGYYDFYYSSWVQLFSESEPMNPNKPEDIESGEMTRKIFLDTDLFVENSFIEPQKYKRYLRTEDEELQLNAWILNKHENVIKILLYSGPVKGNSLIWESSNPDVATVSKKGLVKAHNTGKTKITAKFSNGVVFGTYDVFVKLPCTEADRQGK